MPQPKRLPETSLPSPHGAVSAPTLEIDWDLFWRLLDRHGVDGNADWSGDRFWRSMRRHNT